MLWYMCAIGRSDHALTHTCTLLTASRKMMAQAFDATCLSAAARFGQKLGTIVRLKTCRLVAWGPREKGFCDFACLQKPPWQGAFLPPVPVTLFAVTSLGRPEHNVNQSSHCHSDCFDTPAETTCQISAKVFHKNSKL